METEREEDVEKRMETGREEDVEKRMETGREQQVELCDSCGFKNPGLLL